MFESFKFTKKSIKGATITVARDELTATSDSLRKWKNSRKQLKIEGKLLQIRSVRRKRKIG